MKASSALFIGLGIGLWLLMGKSGEYISFPYYGFFQPEAVAGIASSFTATNEDDFILASWNWVATQIAYEPIGSDMTFIDQQVNCLKCHLPSETLARGKANCIGKSALLASILLNRIPPNRIYITVGEAHVNGSLGHAWVEIERNGDLYLLESTQAPPVNPWVKASALTSVYMPAAFFSESYFTCSDPDRDLCVSVDK